MLHTADKILTAEQEQVRGVIDRYARIAARVACGVLALGALYLCALYLASR